MVKVKLFLKSGNVAEFEAESFEYQPASWHAVHGASSRRIEYIDMASVEAVVLTVTPTVTDHETESSEVASSEGK